MQLAMDQHLAYWLAQGQMLYGWAQVAQAQPAAGLALMREGLSACETAGSQVAQPYYLACLVDAYRRSHQVAEGRAALAPALSLAAAQGQSLIQAWLYWLQGHLLALSPGGPQDLVPEACFAKTLALARHKGARAWALRAAMELSEIWRQQGKPHDAHHLLHEIYHEFPEGLETAELQEAKIWLDLNTV
jgi:predicted ATPase